MIIEKKNGGCMERIAEFQKVSFEQFKEGYLKVKPSADDEKIRDSYSRIKLPERATEFSAGYDFYATYDFELAPGETILIPTGIRAKIDAGWGLFLFPRSGLGFKYRLQLNNTVGVIDGDYYFSDNEGHIFAKITNDSKEEKKLSLSEGDAFIQGVFIPYGLTYNDNVETKRNGGFGSTDK